MRKSHNATTNELSLFANEDFGEEIPTASAEELAPNPKWEFAFLPDTDFIADEEVIAFCYSLEVLERINNFNYGQPVFEKLMQGLRDLSQSSYRKVRQQAFTVFVGDVFSTNSFVIGVATVAKSNGEIIDFLTNYLQNTPGQTFIEAATSYNLLPMFRYDQGYIIQYSDPELAGSSYLDTSDYYGSGTTIYRRCWLPADQINKSRSVYGKLIQLAKEGKQA